MKKTRVLWCAVCALVLFLSHVSHSAAAQELYADQSETILAEVVRVLETETRTIPGTDTPHMYQTIEARIAEGERKGTLVTVENDYLALKPGSRFFAIHYVDIQGTEYWSVQDVDRRRSLVGLGLVALFAIIAFGGWYGVRSLLSLFGSLLVFAYVLVPGLLHGISPLVVSFGVATLVLAGALFITHGINRESVVAFVGTMGAIVVTLLFARFAVDASALSGFASSESVTLNFNTRGTLDMAGLLIGAIVLGALGVLDAIAITQVALVRELFRSDPHAPRDKVFLRALRVGREHVGAVVNTLAFAYVGAAMPLVLLLHLTPTPLGILLNMELFATEIVRTIAGSIGIVLTVPLVTLLAVHVLRTQAPDHERAHAHHGRA